MNEYGYVPAMKDGETYAEWMRRVASEFGDESREDCPLLTDKEFMTVLAAAIASNSVIHGTPEEIEPFINWALEVKIGVSMLELIAKGMVRINLNDQNEVVFQIVPGGVPNVD